MTDKFIFNYIALKEQQNPEFIRYSYYELKIKSNLSDEEIDRFLKVNRDYFENLKDTHTTKVSSNFVIGLEGEIIQCIPPSEIACASNSRNTDPVSIECCHPDETGKFTDATYDSLVQLTAFLCSKFNLTENDVIRHYDITGKDCPKYFVENEAAWETFRSDVGAVLAEYA